MKRLAHLLLFMAVGVLILHDHIVRLEASHASVLSAGAHLPSDSAIAHVHERLHAYTLTKSCQGIDALEPLWLAHFEQIERIDNPITTPLLHPPARQ